MNELFLGNCLEVLDTIPSKSVDLVLCDPPYETMGQAGDRTRFKHIKSGLKYHKWDKRIDGNFLLPKLKRVLQPNAVVIIFYQISASVKGDQLEGFDKYFKYSHKYVWIKDHFGNPFNAKKLPLSLFEEIAVFKNGLNGTFNLPEGAKYKSNVLEYAKDKEKLHTTQKPVNLLKDLISTYSNEGDVVLDYAMGSGSTCVAAKECDRNYIGIEKDEKYYNIAKDRLND